MTDHPTLEAARQIVARITNCMFGGECKNPCPCRDDAREILALTQWRPIDDEARNGKEWLCLWAQTGSCRIAYSVQGARWWYSAETGEAFSEPSYYAPLPPPPADGETR